MQTSIISVGNSIQSYLTLKYTARVYNPTGVDPPPQTPKQVTALSSRTFGTWTFLAAILRFYVAYNIEDEKMYQLGLWVYAVAFAHFTSEWVVFKSARWGKGIAPPFFISSGTLIWMWLQYDAYVKA